MCKRGRVEALSALRRGLLTRRVTQPARGRMAMGRACVCVHAGEE